MALSKLRRKTGGELSDEALALQGMSSELFEFGEFEGCFGMDIKRFCAGYYVTDRVYGYSIPVESHEPLDNLCVFILEKTSVTSDESKLEGIERAKISRYIILRADYLSLPYDEFNKLGEQELNMSIYGFIDGIDDPLLLNAGETHMFRTKFKVGSGNPYDLISIALMDLAGILPVLCDSGNISWTNPESFPELLMNERRAQSLCIDINSFNALFKRVAVDYPNVDFSSLPDITVSHVDNCVTANAFAYDVLYGNAPKPRRIDKPVVRKEPVIPKTSTVETVDEITSEVKQLITPAEEVITQVIDIGQVLDAKDMPNYCDDKPTAIPRFIKTVMARGLNPTISDHITKHMPSHWAIANDKAVSDNRQLLQPATIEVITSDSTYYLFFVFRKTGHMMYFKCDINTELPNQGLDEVCSYLYNEIEDYCKVSGTLDTAKSLFLIDLVNGRFNSLLNINAVYIDEPMTHPELNLFAMHCMEYSGSNLILDELSEVKYLNPYHWLDISNNIVRASGDMATATIYFDATGTLSHIDVERNGYGPDNLSFDITIDDTSSSGFKITDRWDNDFELSRPTLAAVYKHAYLEHGGVLKW